MESRNITENDYNVLLELDKKVYPTDSPVTPEILNKWFSKNPEFGIVYENNGKIVGMTIAIPLTKTGWEQLISGQLLESDLDEKTIFDNNRDKEIGIHVYHIEKLSEEIDKFHLDSLKDLNNIVENLRIKNSQLKVIGFSGLCVTSYGIGLFYNKFNCREREFINSEIILEKNKEIKIADEENKKELNEYLLNEWEYRNRCKMLVLYPDEISIVWKHIKN